MRSFIVLLVAVLGCTTPSDEPTTVVVEPTTTTPAPPDRGTDVSVSLGVNDDGGSLDASTDANGTSVDAKVDIDAKKKQPQH